MQPIDKLIQEVRKLAAEYPNALYFPVNNICSYTEGIVVKGPKEEGCIFGHAFRAAGFFMPEAGGIISDVLEDEMPEAPQDKKEWCSIVQRQQDNGSEWLWSVKSADKTIQIANTDICEGKE